MEPGSYQVIYGTGLPTSMVWMGSMNDLWNPHFFLGTINNLI